MITCIGNALLDFLAPSNEDFLNQLHMKKGTVSLVDKKTIEKAITQTQVNTVASAGSSANTAYSLASLGAHVSFIGKIASDPLGDQFTRDMSSVSFHTPPTTESIGTGRCLVLVTRDHERTIMTYLGASASLAVSDINEETIKNSKFVHLEGFLFDSKKSYEACLKTVEIAKKHGVQVSLSLSDVLCVKRHYAVMPNFIEKYVDILFANELEAYALSTCNSIPTTCRILQKLCPIGFITRAQNGSLIVVKDNIIPVEAYPVAKESIVDTTGAGDQYAAGALYGLLHNYSLKKIGRIASILGAEIITHLGTKQTKNLSVFLQEHSLT